MAQVSFSIRAAAEGDAAAVAALISQLGYATLESDMLARLVRIRNDPSYHTLVAEVGTAVVGVVGACVAPYYEHNGLYCRLLLLAVDEPHRGRGVEEALVGAAEHWGLTQGATAMLVNSAHHRRDAHRLYGRVGYKSTGVRFVKRLGMAV